MPPAKKKTNVSLHLRQTLTAASLGLASFAFGCAEPTDDVVDGTGSSVEEISLADTNALEIKLDEGWVRGTLVGNTRQFLGVPYAEAPVGTRRFAPPVPVAPWDGVREASAFGPSCVQNPG